MTTVSGHPSNIGLCLDHVKLEFEGTSDVRTYCSSVTYQLPFRMEVLIDNLARNCLHGKSETEKKDIKSFFHLVGCLNTSPLRFEVPTDSHLRLKFTEIFENAVSRDVLIMQAFVWCYLASKSLKMLRDSEKLDLTSLIRIKNRPILRCSKCGKFFTNKGNKRRHQLKCKSAEENPTSACQQCCQH